jgi:GR25 family glycosyltransferase involved in LPS biosynthesis
MKQYNFYIITLFESQERKENAERLKTKLEKYGYNVFIIPAYYYKSVDVMNILKENNIQYASSDYSLSLSQVGCFLSHYMLWDQISKADPNEVHIIVEDDMDLEKDFQINFENENISEYDIISLWRHPAQMNTLVQKVCDGFLKYYTQWGTCVYAITPSASAHLVQSIHSIDVPIDNLLNRDFMHGLKSFIIEENIFTNLGFVDQGPARNSYFKSWIFHLPK